MCAAWCVCARVRMCVCARAGGLKTVEMMRAGRGEYLVYTHEKHFRLVPRSSQRDRICNIRLRDGMHTASRQLLFSTDLHHGHIDTTQRYVKKHNNCGYLNKLVAVL